MNDVDLIYQTMFVAKWLELFKVVAVWPFYNAGHFVLDAVWVTHIEHYVDQESEKERGGRERGDTSHRQIDLWNKCGNPLDFIHNTSCEQIHQQKAKHSVSGTNKMIKTTQAKALQS